MKLQALTDLCRKLPAAQQHRRELALNPAEPAQLGSARPMGNGQPGESSSATVQDVESAQISPLGDEGYLWQATISPGAHRVTGSIADVLERLPPITELMLIYAAPSQAEFDSWHRRNPRLRSEAAEMRRQSLRCLSVKPVLDSSLPSSHEEESPDASEEFEASSSDALGSLGDDSLGKQPLSPHVSGGWGADMGQL